MARVIDVGNDFSPFPGGRFLSDGPNSGEKFREEILIPALRDSHDVTVVLDNVIGLPASFLEEAFGGLIRSGLTLGDLQKRLKVVANTPRFQRYPGLVQEYLLAAGGPTRRAI